MQQALLATASDTATYSCELEGGFGIARSKMGLAIRAVMTILSEGPADTTTANASHSAPRMN